VDNGRRSTDTYEPPTPAAMLAEYRRNTASVERLAGSLKWWRRISLMFFVLILLSVGPAGYEIHTLQRGQRAAAARGQTTKDLVTAIRAAQVVNEATNAAIAKATSPAAQAASAAVVATAIHCLENHFDHATDGLPLDPMCAAK
jgi:hypothetical protein